MVFAIAPLLLRFTTTNGEQISFDYNSAHSNINVIFSTVYFILVNGTCRLVAYMYFWPKSIVVSTMLDVRSRVTFLQINPPRFLPP